VILANELLPDKRLAFLATTINSLLYNFRQQLDIIGKYHISRGTYLLLNAGLARSRQWQSTVAPPHTMWKAVTAKRIFGGRLVPVALIVAHRLQQLPAAVQRRSSVRPAGYRRGSASPCRRDHGRRRLLGWSSSARESHPIWSQARPPAPPRLVVLGEGVPSHLVAGTPATVRGQIRIHAAAVPD
jgi:hypothetical protein